MLLFCSIAPQHPTTMSDRKGQRSFRECAARPSSSSSTPSRRVGSTFGARGNPIVCSFGGMPDARFALLPSAQRPRWNTAPTNQDQLAELRARSDPELLLAGGSMRTGAAGRLPIHRRYLFSDVGRLAKPLLLLGYGMAALTKPLFPWQPRRERSSSHASWIASAKVSGVRRATHWSPMSLPGDSWCVLRSPSIDGYRWGVSWAIAGDIYDDFVRQRHQAGVVVRRRTRPLIVSGDLKIG